MNQQSIGFIGLGAIGLPIAANLVSAGFHLKVHTRSRIAERDERLQGVTPFSSPRDVADGSELLFICVSDDDAVKSILFGANSVEESIQEGSLIVDLSTISPSTARSIGKRFQSKGITYIDAPVSGGTEGAQSGNLTIFLGCDENNLERLRPFLNPISTNIFTFGELGRGQEVKALNQILIAGNYVALSEAISLGQKLGLPMDLVINSLQKGAASSWALSNRSENMLLDEYPLGFKLGLHHKDLSIALNVAKEIGLNLPISSQIKNIEEKLIDIGYYDYDLSVLKKSIELNIK